jgi:hypothetical protein
MEGRGARHKFAVWRVCQNSPSVIGMKAPRILNFYLSPAKQRLVGEGTGIFGQIGNVIHNAGWQLRLRDQAEPVGGTGYHLIYNAAVTSLNTLVLRRCYMDPFYRIEATNDRWNWEVATLEFAHGAGAEWFRKYWQNRIFKDHPIGNTGAIFMPLQGRLLERRHFQAMSPIEMIHATLTSDPTRDVIATLHPREVYTAEELRALGEIGGRFALSKRPSMSLLAQCDYVVTENSAMALAGFFAKKPAVLFANIDFHHIAGSVPHMGVKAAFDDLAKPKPFARYLHWFFKQHAISAEAEDATAQIVTRLRQHHWPI